MAKRTKQSRHIDPATRQAVAAAADVGFGVLELSQATGLSPNDIARIYRSEISKTYTLPARERFREQFIEKGYELAFKLLEAACDPDKIAEASLKEIVAALGIIMDKVLIASGRFEQKDVQDFSPIAAMNDEQLDRFIVETQKTLKLFYEHSYKGAEDLFPNRPTPEAEYMAEGAEADATGGASNVWVGLDGPSPSSDRAADAAADGEVDPNVEG